MKRIDLDIRLLEDAVFSERSATIGGHRGLDYIPGSALLGAAAARLYRQLESEEAWLLFHSGRLRFGNGMPLFQGLPTRPVPKAMHYPKGKPYKDDQQQQLIPAHCKNLCLVDPASLGEQHQQLRKGYLNAAGGYLETTLRYEMRTALVQGQRRAQESQLFGYMAIPAGQCFRASIEADETIPHALLERLREVLAEGIFLGRSRAAEYGRCELIVDEIKPYAPALPEARQELDLWLLADMALLDQHGQPTCSPTPECLGLPAGRLVAEKSFIGTRRYSPWNAHRRGHDLERMVISQGSVLHFRFDSVPSPQALAHLAHGVGLYREAGLGQVAVNPPLLQSAQPCFEHAHAADNTASTHARPDHPLIDWLEHSQHAVSARKTIQENAERFAKELATCYDHARAYLGGNSLPVGPSPSQWGNVIDALRGGERGKLFDRHNGVARADMKGWEDGIGKTKAGTQMCFSDWFAERIENMPLRDLQACADRAQDVARTYHQKGGKA